MHVLNTLQLLPLDQVWVTSCSTATILPSHTSTSKSSNNYILHSLIYLTYHIVFKIKHRIYLLIHISDMSNSLICKQKAKQLCLSTQCTSSPFLLLKFNILFIIFNDSSRKPLYSLNTTGKHCLSPLYKCYVMKLKSLFYILYSLLLLTGYEQPVSTFRCNVHQRYKLSNINSRKKVYGIEFYKH